MQTKTQSDGWMARAFSALRPFVIGMLVITLSACASIHGRPKQITAADVKERVCPSEAHMDKFASLTGDARGAYRDRVISICIGAYNDRFAEFTASLSEESTSTNLAVDVAATSLTTLAGIASPKTAKRLTAGAGLALGLGAAVNKDVFYNATLPALLTAMEAKRAEILTGIIEAEKADPQGLNYSLARAGLDIDRYEEAGTLVTGLNELNKAAGAAATKASNQLATAQRTRGLTFTPVILDATVNQRIAALTAKVKALPDTPIGRAKLDAIAQALGMTPDDDDETDVKVGYVITAILDIVNVPVPADQKARITNIENDLDPLF